jgi:hypothetical protein
VSYGLAADIRTTGSPSGGSVPVELTVRGPSWSTATELVVYSNGIPVWNRKMEPKRTPGIKYSQRTRIPIPANDAALVAVVTGPGVLEPFWEVRKSYQPTSLDWEPIVVGVSRAVWVDADGNGKRDAPLDVARTLVGKMTPVEIIRRLTGYDSSVTKHAASLLGPESPEVRSAFDKAAPAVRQSYTAFLEEFRRLGPPRP